MNYRDTTFCASPKCENKCGRMLTKQEKQLIGDDEWISWAYFCGEPTSSCCSAHAGSYYECKD